MKRRNLIASSLAACCLSACGKEYPRFFDIEWDEEVLLHDGRIIWIHMKRTYERLSKSEEWNGIHRDTEISFDAGGKIGRFTQKFERYDVTLLDQKSGKWFVGLSVTTGSPTVEWVNFETPFLSLSSTGELTKEKLENFPVEFVKFNIMPDTPDSQGIAKYNGTRLSASQKEAHWMRFPRGAGDDMRIRVRKVNSIVKEQK